jgi:hypothetical protein
MTRRAVAIGFVSVLAAAALALGGQRLLLRPAFNEYEQLVFYPGKHETARPEIGPRTMVAFVFGQSNSANHGNEKFAVTDRRVSNFWNGRYFLAEDPLLGATGTGGSVWTRTAHRLIERKVFDSAVLIAAGVASTPVAAWTEGGTLNAMLEQRLVSARNAGLEVTHFLWHQGESDNTAAGPAAYDAAMQPIISLTRRYFPRSKFFVARATICGKGAIPNVDLQAAQADLARLPRVYVGPDTDAIGRDGRYDDCHFNGVGLDRHAAGWAIAIAAHPD